MTISLWLGITLVTSLVVNGVLIWFSKEQSRELTTIADNSEDLLEMMNGFRNHLKAVYELDSFYGDETLKALMDHAGSLSVILEDQYGDIASLSEPVEYEEIGEQDAPQENEKEKHVLYAGTRRRDS
jgi:hypothetical protein